MATSTTAIMAIVEIAKYISKGGKACTGWDVGATVGSGSATKDVTACDGQYELDPSKEA